VFATCATTAADSTLPTLLGFAAIALLLFGPVAAHASRRRRNGRARHARSLPTRARRAKPHAAPGRMPPDYATASANERAAGPIRAPRTGPAEATRPAATPAPPGGAPSTVAPDTLAPLGERLDRSRRIGLAEARVADVLDRLPRERWLVERYVMVGGHRIPFLVLGETGVFLLWALDEAPGWDDLPFVNHAAGAIADLLPGYHGPVQVAFCRAFDPIKARWWYRHEDGVGAWQLGLNRLERWLLHFGREHGLGVDDVARSAELAGPHWRRRPPAGLPRIPNVG
jgi:hypothetical protein